MARAPSAVLSPADKKNVIKNLKAQLKDATDGIKALNKSSAVAQKAHDKLLAANIKDSGKLEKVAAKLQADLNAMAPAVVAA
mgnify:CR=1 FL=1